MQGTTPRDDATSGIDRIHLGLGGTTPNSHADPYRFAPEESASLEATRSEFARRVGRLASAAGHRLAVAESLTGGMLSSDLAQTEDASSWFQGGVVSYAAQVKYDVLNVRPGPVISEEAVCDMAKGVATLYNATAALAVTGVGGPGPVEGHEPGTVWIAFTHDGTTEAQLHRLHGSPAQVCSASCALALEMAWRRLGGDPSVQ